MSSDHDWPYDTRYCGTCEAPRAFETRETEAEGKDHDWCYCTDCGAPVGHPDAGAGGVTVSCANLEAEDAVLHNLEVTMCVAARVIKHPDMTDLATAAEYHDVRLCENCIWPAEAEAVT